MCVSPYPEELPRSSSDIVHVFGNETLAMSCRTLCAWTSLARLRMRIDLMQEGVWLCNNMQAMAEGWTQHVDTELVSSDWEASIRRGTHPPRPLTTPIYSASTFRLGSAREGEDLSNTLAKVSPTSCVSFSSNFCFVHQDGYLYSRWGNPTVDAAASVITSLEGAAGTLLFSSGMSAIITTLFTFLRAGDHAVSEAEISLSEPAIISQMFPHTGYMSSLLWWIECICRRLSLSPWCGGFVGSYQQPASLQRCSLGQYQGEGALLSVNSAYIDSCLQLLYTEVPANPTMSVVDIADLATFASTTPNLVTAVDATFATPYLMQPIKLGIDVCIHSWSVIQCKIEKLYYYCPHSTKYLAGHTDLIGGCLSYSTAELGHKLHNTQILMGPSMVDEPLLLVTL